MRHLIPNLAGTSRIYAIFGDPIYQIQTPHLINPIFAAHEADIYAVPFHVTTEQFSGAWDTIAAMPNIAGIGVTVPHKVTAAQRCTTLTATAKAVGAVNAVQRGIDGRMNGALFDGLGFVAGLGDRREALGNANILMVGAGGAGRAIAFALAEAGIRELSLMDLDPASIAFTASMVNAVSGRECARARHSSDTWAYDVVINASSIGVKGTTSFPMPENALRADMLVADIAALAADTNLLKAARAVGAAVADGNDMLRSQIELIAGFAAGLPAGTPMGL